MNSMMLMLTVVMGVGLFGKVELPNIFLEPLPSMTIYHYDKTVESSKSVGKNDDEYKTISQFLKENKFGWEYDARSYAPTIVFKAPNYTINCILDGVVINYQNTKGHWKQISKSSKTPYCGLPPMKE